MSADLLREAAALMRSRAEAATGSPWTATSRPHGGPFIANPENREAVARGYTGPRMRPDAEHIASWHPAVALAVADQLDAIAAVVEEAAGTPLAIVAEGLAEKSVAVATTYLGGAR